MSLRRRSLWILAIGILSVAAPWGVPPAASDAPVVDLSGPRAAVVKELEALASTANGQRLFRFRDRVFGLVILLSPDHERARRALKFRRDDKDKARPWKQAPDYRPPTDWAPAMLPKAEERLRACLQTYRDAVLASLSAVRDLSEGTKEATLEELSLLLPQDREIHQIRGDVEREGRWLMPETVSALEERKKFKEAVAAAERIAQDGIRPTADLPGSFEGEGFEIDGVVPYLGRDMEAEGLKVGRRRVFGWTGEKWTRESLRFLVVGSILTAHVVQAPLAAYMAPKETLLFPDEAAAKAWMLNNPARATAQDVAEVSAVGSLTIEDDTKVVYFGHEPYKRTSALCSAVYGGIYAGCPDELEERAWHRYGLGARIIQYVTDLRPPQSVSLEGTEHLTEGHKEPALPESLSAWMGVAASLLEDGGAERISRLLTVRTNAMRPSDLLVAYALAAYLREGRPDDYPKFVDASRKGSDAASVVREALGWDLETLARRLRRWASEQGGSLGTR